MSVEYCLPYTLRVLVICFANVREDEWLISFVYYGTNINICFTTISIFLYKIREFFRALTVRSLAKDGFAP